MNPIQPSAEVVDEVADLLKSRIGLRPDPFLRSRLGRSIRDEAALRGQDVDDYLQNLLVIDGALQGLLNRVTVQETGFFRHPEHFLVLSQDLLPSLPQPIRIWSAGCANGQEAFSLAMLLDEHRIDGSVIATDLSTAALHRTATARYSTRELTGLSPERIARHLRQNRGAWEVNQALRSRVTTLRHNLMNPLPDEVRSSQVVFCRNVLIYFSPEHTKAFLDRLADTLPAAWLFLGSAETMWTVSDRYETIRLGDAYTYRPRGATPARPALRAAQNIKRTRAVSGAKPSLGRSHAQRGAVAADPPTTRPGKSPESSPQYGSVASDADPAITHLSRTGQEALSDGDHAAAVVQFRKWVYLAHDDAVAHLHLGLALEAAGDTPSAQRAFGAARRALQQADPSRVALAIGGYAPAELLRLLDAKQQVLSP
jgi:chemotaxis protein methyltransferase CheR